MLNLLPKFLPRKDASDSVYERLLRQEAKAGGELFGTVPKGGRREFFCLDEQTWVWHEEWTDSDGTRRVVTTRYDVRPSGIVKAQGTQYQKLSREEARNFCQAVDLYRKRIGGEYQRLLQAA